MDNGVAFCNPNPERILIQMSRIFLLYVWIVFFVIFDRVCIYRFQFPSEVSDIFHVSDGGRYVQNNMLSGTVPSGLLNKNLVFEWVSVLILGLYIFFIVLLSETNCFSWKEILPTCTWFYFLERLKSLWSLNFCLFFLFGGEFLYIMLERFLWK